MPIVGSMAETASVFMTYTTLQKLIRSVSTGSDSESRNAALSLSQLGLAAAGAGAFTSFIL